MASAAFSAYMALLKPRVMSLVVFTSIVGMVLAPVGLPPIAAVVAILCIAIGAGAAGALNMWYDRDIDCIMSRTSSRPIPTGRVTADQALIFGTTLSVASVAVLGLLTNWVAAGLLAITIAYYVLIYTVWLKRRSAQSVVIGGVAGALPPVVGWAAATGSIGLPALTLFAIILIWTPPHSWALALFRSDDYARAKLPLLPIDKGHNAAKRQIFGYSLLLVPVALSPYFTGIANLVYLAIALPFSLYFLYLAWQLRQSPDTETDARAKALFKFSILYLFVLFAVLLVVRGITAIFA